MKKAAFIFFLFLALCQVLPAQNTRVYDFPLDSIKFLVEEHPDAYDRIAATFHNDIDTISWAEKTILYYGSAYRPTYAPYGERSKTDEIWDLLDEEEYDQAINRIDELLNDEPANLTGLRQKAYCYIGKDDTVMAEKYFEKYYGLMAIPFHSGSGESADSAIFVRSVDDEYAIVKALDGQVVMQKLIEEDGHSYDVLTVALSDKEQFDLWFNIDQPFGIGLVKMFEGIGETDTNKTLSKAEKKKRKKQEKQRKKEEKRKAKEAKREAKKRGN